MSCDIKTPYTSDGGMLPHMKRKVDNMVWIGHRKAKDRRGGQAPAYSKKKTAVRGPSSYTLFSKQFNREASSKEEHFKAVSKKWGELTEDEKCKYQQQARNIRSSDLKGLSEDEAIAHHFKQIENSINIISSLGSESMMVASTEHEAPHLFGTNRGLNYIGQPQVLENFRKSVFEKATGDSKPIPYVSLLKVKMAWKLEGLPVTFKDPSNYGVADLKKILDHKAGIKFVMKQMLECEPGSAEEIVDFIVADPLEPVHDLSDGLFELNTSKRKITAAKNSKGESTALHTKKRKFVGQKDYTRYEIDHLVEDRKGAAGQEFLMHWKGYSPNDRTWELVSCLPPAALSFYWQKKYSL